MLDHRLVAEDPDLIPKDATLVSLAVRIAKPVFDRDCARCHQADLRGDKRFGVPDLTTGQFLYGTDQVSSIERTIAYGIRSRRPKAWNLAYMPAFATPNPYNRYQITPLRPAQIDDVIDYLYSLAGRPADPAAAEEGRLLYHNEAACFDCHGEDASGDSAIGAPSLIGTHWLYGNGDREDLFRSIAYGHAGICPGWSRAPDPAKIRALAVYIYFTAHGGASARADAGSTTPGSHG